MCNNCPPVVPSTPRKWARSVISPDSRPPPLVVAEPEFEARNPAASLPAARSTLSRRTHSMPGDLLSLGRVQHYPNCCKIHSTAASTLLVLLAASAAWRFGKPNASSCAASSACSGRNRGGATTGSATAGSSASSFRVSPTHSSTSEIQLPAPMFGPGRSWGSGRIGGGRKRSGALASGPACCCCCCSGQRCCDRGTCGSSCNCGDGCG